MCVLSVMNSPPKLKDLYNLITPEYAAHWKVIGTLLGIESGILTGIERNFPSNVSWCCNELLETWLERDTESSWKKIIQVIDSPAVTSLVAASFTTVISPQALLGNFHSYLITITIIIIIELYKSCYVLCASLQEQLLICLQGWLHIVRLIIQAFIN